MKRHGTILKELIAQLRWGYCSSHVGIVRNGVPLEKSELIGGYLLVGSGHVRDALHPEVAPGESDHSWNRSMLVWK